MLERKHVEAIADAIYAETRDHAEWTSGVRIALDSAIAACDESPCVWERRPHATVMYASCGAINGDIPTYCTPEHRRVDAIYCPHCGRKIALLPAAPEVGK